RWTGRRRRRRAGAARKQAPARSRGRAPRSTRRDASRALRGGGRRGRRVDDGADALGELGELHLLLGARGEILHLGGTLGELALTEDDGDAGPERVGAPELRLDRGLARVDLAADAGAPHVASEDERRERGLLADRRDEDVDHARARLGIAR